jgi:hypothetical protein
MMLGLGDDEVQREIAAGDLEVPDEVGGACDHHAPTVLHEHGAGRRNRESTRVARPAAINACAPDPVGRRVRRRRRFLVLIVAPVTSVSTRRRRGAVTSASLTALSALNARRCPPFARGLPFQCLLPAATGRRLTYRIIADCVGRENVIHDEWLIRDQGAIMRQLGVDPRRYAADRIAAEGGPEACARPLTLETDRPGRYRGRGNDHPVGARYADLLTRIMGADMAAVPREYDRAAQLEHPDGATAHGHDGADRFWMRLRAASPAAAAEAPAP